MVTRVGKITKISFKIDPNKVAQIKKSIQTEFPDEYKMSYRKNELSVTGDFSSYKKRNKILYILSGGKLGENV